MLQTTSLAPLRTVRRLARPGVAPAHARALHARAADMRARLTPSTNDLERIKPRVEKAVFGFGFINPMLTLPQLYNIYVVKHVAGLSVVTLSGALLMSVLWTLHGALGKQTVVWSTSAVWVVVNAVTLLGVAAAAG